jgi:dihydroxyacid dehydratase/phosphogluconate dehydratase
MRPPSQHGSRACGMSLPYSSTMANEDREKRDSAAESARAAPRYVRGVLAKYASHVSTSSLGAITDLDER